VGRVSGAGNSNTVKSYGLEDFATSPNAYYRISQQDFDGTKVVFNPIGVNCLDFVVNDNMTVFPNPATDEFTVQIVVEKTHKEATIQLVDVNGRVVNARNISLVAGENIFPFNTAGLTAGTYTVNVI